jgi:hypothetical protein
VLLYLVISTKLCWNFLMLERLNFLFIVNCGSLFLLIFSRSTMIQLLEIPYLRKQQSVKILEVILLNIFLPTLLFLVKLSQLSWQIIWQSLQAYLILFWKVTRLHLLLLFNCSPSLKTGWLLPLFTLFIPLF